MSSRDSGRRGKGSCCQQVVVLLLRVWLLEKRRRRGLGEIEEEAEAQEEGTLWRRVAGVLGWVGGKGGC